ncbi:hypothetical protein RJ641_029101 [Dillenia turbinata]|uniref:Sulfotransferase n=1 Tax=Dillenia turbinata TaxID=194707 RepID=A0AAN8ZMM1_9MAGN
MAEDLCFITKDTLIIKAPKKSPLLLRMLLLAFAMVCGVYMCTICLKQTTSGHQTKNKFQNIELIDESQRCDLSGIDQSEIHYLHFPNPKTFSREECSCNPVRYFAILSMQRSGSGWFETLLNSHINVSSNGEIFSVRERRINASAVVKTMDKIYNLDWFTSASKNECSAAVGFKWMLNQGLIENQKVVVDYFNKKGVSTIFLFRRNQLRRMISARILAKYKPKIDTSGLIRELQKLEETIRKTLDYFKSTRHIVLYYEDVVKNRTKLADVQDFLWLPRRDLHSRQVKIHRGHLSDHVENWKDIEQTLKGTSFESFIGADYRK